MIRRFLRVLHSAVICWILTVFLVFVLSDVVPWPRWLELPWSGFDDFAVTPAGRVLVYSSFFSQLLVYDLEGDFQTSLPGVQRGGYHYLAVDVEGRVYASGTPALCEAGALGSDDFSFRCRGAGAEDASGWRLNYAGVAEPVFSPAPAPNRAVRPGEMLITFDSRPWKRFNLESGGWVERCGDRLTVHRPLGESVTIATPWYLYWVKFPVPGALGWILGILMAGTQDWRRRRARRRANGSPGGRAYSPGPHKERSDAVRAPGQGPERARPGGAKPRQSF